MLTLTPNECRVLGVLVEKAQTTPQQYPLTLNALVNGANQRNNREPITNLTEEQVLESLDSLRVKGFAREVMLSGSRVQKFRHVAREILEIDTNQLVVLAELLLRGPQTIGELRGRASRMHPLATTEIVKNILDSLMNRPASPLDSTSASTSGGGGGGPLVRELPPAPGDRANRYAQLLCPDLHPLDAPAPAAALAHAGAAGCTRSAVADSSATELARRVQKLEAELAQLRQLVQRLAQDLGEPDTLSTAP